MHKSFFALIFLSTVRGTKPTQTWKMHRRSVPTPQKSTGMLSLTPPRTSQTHQYHPTHPCCTGWSCKITWVLVSSGFSPSFPSLGTTTTSPTGTLTSAFAISHMKPGGGGVPWCCRGQGRGRSVPQQPRCLCRERGRQRCVSMIAWSCRSQGRARGDRGASRAKLRLQRGDQAF